jgi:hypothetical protein
MTRVSATQDGIGLERRLASFDHDGTLAADCREIWSYMSGAAGRAPTSTRKY